LSFKRQFLKIERSEGIVYQKQLFGEVGEAKIDAQVSIEESLKHFVREVAETCITARKIQTAVSKGQLENYALNSIFEWFGQEANRKES